MLAVRRATQRLEAVEGLRKKTTVFCTLPLVAFTGSLFLAEMRSKP
jgi:hypothetical protein